MLIKAWPFALECRWASRTLPIGFGELGNVIRELIAREFPD
jgi:hypothetical protein